VQLGQTDVEKLCAQLVEQEPGYQLPVYFKSRLQAAMLLADKKDPAGAPCLLMAAVSDPEVLIRKTAVIGLKYMVGSSAVADRLAYRLDEAEGEKNAEIRQLILGTLRTIMTVSMPYELRSVVGNRILLRSQDSNEQVRESAKETLNDLVARNIVVPGMLWPVPKPPAPTPKDENGDQKKPSSGLSTGAKVGIGLGIFGALGAIIAVAMVKD
jgi:hypothetical protein